MRISILLRTQCMSFACKRQRLTLQQHAQGHLSADETIPEPALGEHIHLQTPPRISRPAQAHIGKRGDRR